MVREARAQSITWMETDLAANTGAFERAPGVMSETALIKKRYIKAYVRTSPLDQWSTEIFRLSSKEAD